MQIRPPGLDQNLRLMCHHQMLPNDDQEQDRLDMLHHVFRLTLGGALCRTRLDNPQKILDVGTGTGIWAIES
jgi:ribosomal protein L11 methylase PrmA